MFHLRYVCVDCQQWTPTEADWLHCRSLVASSEFERCGRFMFIEDAKMAIIGRLILRRLASELLAQPSGLIPLCRNSHNRPVILTSTQNVDLNISHHANCVVGIGITSPLTNPPVQIGVDLVDASEHPRSGSVAELLALMCTSFTPSEWTYINSYPTIEQKLQAFYQNWALKEAYVKAIGLGLSQPLDTLEFNFTDNNHVTLRVLSKPVASQWHFQLLPVPSLHEQSNYWMALASNVELQKIDMTQEATTLTFQDLIHPLTEVDPQSTLAVEMFMRMQKRT